MSGETIPEVAPVAATARVGARVRRRGCRAAPAALAAAVVLAACSGGDPGGGTATPDTIGTSAAGPATTTPTAAAPATTAPAPTAPAPTAPAPAPTATSPTGAATRPVLAFPDAASVAGWVGVNDTVMGGRSDGGVDWRDGALVFAGVLSLENNGGFSSIRSPFDPAIGAAMGAATAVLLDATGDGKTYVLHLRSGSSGRVAHLQRFTTAAGQARTHVLPVADFEPVGPRLQPEPWAPPLDPAAVVQVTIYLLDEQVGPFSLAVRSIAVR